MNTIPFDDDLMDVMTWRGLFSDEMRRRGASGRQIGEAWATVESHCVEIRQHPQLAFGDPAEYAATLSGTKPRWWGLARGMAPVWLTTLAVFLASTLPLAFGVRRVQITVGVLVGIPASLVLMALIIPTAHLMKRRPGRGAIPFMVLLFTWQLLLQLFRTWTSAAFTMSATACWALFGITVLAATVLALLFCRDRAIDPRTGSTFSDVPAAAWWFAASAAAWIPLGFVALRLLSR